MAGYTCPFCGQIMSLSQDTYQTRDVGFSINYQNMQPITTKGSFAIQIHLYRCPNCKKISIIATELSPDFDGLEVNIYPSSKYIQYPDYIPQAIRSDYEEACAIVNLSPKASATLSRRCLQGMIRDFWKISKNRLVDEIEALQGKIPAAQWRVIDKVRKIGNIGAHMEKDVNYIIDIDPSEAQKLIKLIELLIKSWYINRYEEEQLYADIENIGDEKDKQKHTN